MARLALALFLLPVLQDTKETEGKVPWLKEYAKAIEASQDTGKPIFIFFGCC